MKKKKRFKPRVQLYHPGKNPQPRRIIGESSVSARLPDKPTRQMLRAQQRKGG